MNIYAFKDYRSIIQSYLSDNKHVKGYRSHLVKAAGCSLSFLSQVLNSETHLTIDHGAQMCDFWGLQDDQTEFFLDLISLERSASTSLKKYLTKRIAKNRVESKKLVKQAQQKKLDISQSLKESIYYSSWHYAAIHVLTAIPGFQEIATISKRLDLPSVLVERILLDLLAIGVVSNKGSKWQVLGHSIFLRKESPLSTINLSNWRQQAMKHQAADPHDGVHYSGLYALSRNDAIKLMKNVEQFIRETHQTVEVSQEEELVCLNIDFFGV